MKKTTEDLSRLDFDTLSLPCPALTDSHHAWRSKVRDFVDTRIAPHIDEWETRGACPDDLLVNAADAGILGAGFAPEFGGTAGDFDLYHRMIAAEEMHRLGTGVVFADMATHWIALPPVLSHGAQDLRDRVARPVLRGEKRIALGVTEPSGGSDVSNLRSTARRDGDHYIVDGEKTLISGGMRADYLLAAVRTGDAGMGGISMLLIDMHLQGVERHPVEGIAWYNANLAHIRLKEVRVPANALIGEENRGFAALARQFNVERFSGISATLAMSRVCLAEAIAWSRSRETFGALLASRQVIRHKIVDMLRRIHAAQAYLFHCADRYERGEEPVADLALLKIQATTTLEHCAREAMQILAGAAWTGKNRIEHIYREARIFSIGGGTEEILKDMVARQLKL